jgi:hypothetical protein
MGYKDTWNKRDTRPQVVQKNAKREAKTNYSVHVYYLHLHPMEKEESGVMLAF